MNKCDPAPPDPETPIKEAFGSPKQFYATVADSIPDAHLARIPGSKSANDMEPLHLHGSPQRNRGLSRSATAMMSPAEQSQVANHMSAHEPKMFPGMVYQRERRRSLRISTSGSDVGYLGPAISQMTVEERSEESNADESD